MQMRVVQGTTAASEPMAVRQFVLLLGRDGPRLRIVSVLRQGTVLSLRRQRQRDGFRGRRKLR